MSINLICPKCRKTYRLKTRQCSCGSSLTGRYNVRVKTPSGKYPTKVTDNLTDTRKLEAKWKAEALQEVHLGIKFKAPMVSEVWSEYLKYIKTHKRSWLADQGRWTLHIEPLIRTKRMDQVTLRDVAAILDRMRKEKTHRGRSFAPAFIRQTPVMLRRFFNRSRKQGLYDGPNPGASVHDAARHTFASVLISSEKVDLFTLQKLLTHRSISQAQRCVHLAPEALRRDADATADLFEENRRLDPWQYGLRYDRSTWGILIGRFQQE